MARLQEKYKKEIIPVLKKQFDYSNDFMVPKVTKVVLNVGVGHGLKEAAFLEVVESTLERITGQKVIKTKAKKSVSAFKIREGMVVGMAVTLRSHKMYDFIDKLVNVTLPRVRDFQGLKLKSLDAQGNLTIGFREHLPFGEIEPDEVEKIHGLEVTVVTTAKTYEEGLALLKLMGFPFKRQ